MKEPYYTIGAMKNLPVLILWVTYLSPPTPQSSNELIQSPSHQKGDNDDTVPFSEGLVQAVPHAKLIVLKNATHDAVVLEQDIIQGAIVDFLVPRKWDAFSILFIFLFIYLFHFCNCYYK